MRGDKKQAAPIAGILNAPRICANGGWHVPYAITAAGWLEAEFSTPQQALATNRIVASEDNSAYGVEDSAARRLS
jgi:hypothetical protein